MKPGRNDPCPCGSGKKYKQCCLAAETAAVDSPRELLWRRVSRAIHGYAQVLISFIDDVYGPGIADEAWAEFTLGEETTCDPESPHFSVFFPWFFHHWVPDPMEGTKIEDESLHLRAPTSLFLERRGSRMDQLLRRYLQACVGSPFTFLEIKQCTPGQALLALDLLTGDEREVRDRSVPTDLEPGDILFCQPVAIDGITVLESRAECPFPPFVKQDILDLRAGMRVLTLWRASYVRITSPNQPSRTSGGKVGTLSRQMRASTGMQSDPDITQKHGDGCGPGSRHSVARIAP